MSTAELIDKRFEALEELQKDIKKSLDGLNQADPGVRAGDDSASYWLAADEQEIIGAARPRARAKNRLPRGYKPHQVWKSNGEFLSDVCKLGVRSAEFTAKHSQVCKAVQGMSEGVLADGGAWVVPEYSQQIFDHAFDNSLWEQTDGYTVTGNTITFPRLNETSRANGSRAGGILGYWLAEGATATGTNPQFGTFSLRLKKLAVLVYLTQELIDDAGPALAQYVTRKVQEEMKFQLGNGVINGNGGAQPLGIINSPARVAVAKETGQAAASIVPANVHKMWSRLRPSAMPNSKFYINQDCYPQLFGMTLDVGTGGMPVYLPPGGLSQAPFGTLLGRPIEVTEFNPTVGTEGDVILADPKAYVTINKGGVQQAQSMHVEFLTDQQALRFIIRVDGEPWENAPLTPFQGTATQSSFVTLATRS